MDEKQRANGASGTESFFHRWSRLKNEGKREPNRYAAATEQMALSDARMPEPRGNTDGSEQRLPTLDDVTRLTADSDYSAFVANGVDKSVQRLAMKKLFSDPHFNRMDGLDIYIGDYNKPDPISDGMLALLKHAENFLARTPSVGDAGSAEEMPDEDEVRAEQNANRRERGIGEQ